MASPFVDDEKTFLLLQEGSTNVALAGYLRSDLYRTVLAVVESSVRARGMVEVAENKSQDLLMRPRKAPPPAAARSGEHELVGLKSYCCRGNLKLHSLVGEFCFGRPSR